jgi:tetratricopeptide (TPR) repeat protein
VPTRLEVLEKLVAAGGEDPFPYYGLAMEYKTAGRPEDALRVFARLRARFPRYVPQYLMAGQLCEALGRRDEARDWLASGIAAARDARDPHALSELEGALVGLP